MFIPISKPSLLKYLFILAFVFGSSFSSFGQAGRVYTVAGGGTDTVDGVLATNSIIWHVTQLGVDGNHNIYFSERAVSVIRKIDFGTGIIQTVAGISRSSDTCFGDGGPATAASLGSSAEGVYVTESGNIFIADGGCYHPYVRKVDGASGIITTVGGGGSSILDSVPATSASIGFEKIYADNFNNIYIGVNRIRRIDGFTGIITNFAGRDTSVYVSTGDGGPATSATFRYIRSFCQDNLGNSYIMDEDRVRKIDVHTGIITTVAGGGTDATSENIPATNAILDFSDVAVDGAGNIFTSGSNSIRRVDASTGLINTIASGFTSYGLLLDPSSGNIYFCGGTRIYRFSYSPLIPFSSTIRDSFYTTVHKRCIGPQLTVRTNRFHIGMRVRTDFGDGSYDTSTINTSWSGIQGFALVNHSYAANRTYNITQVLDSAGIPKDTISTTYNHVFCSDMSVSFYNDIDADCTKDSSEIYLMHQVITEVDSNSVPVDTIMATSGFHYIAYGNPSDIYSFKVISRPIGLVTSCPTTGIIYDTLRAGITTNTPQKMALACIGSSSNIDLEARAYVPVTRPNNQWGHLYLRNNYCPPADGMVTLNFSPKYVYTGGANPTPTSTTASSLTWNLSTLTSISSAPTDIYFSLYHNSAFAFPSDGDTVNERITITPTSGPPDVNIANNVVVRVDTVRTSCDPNAIEVVPGCFRNDTTFLCTIHFENIGRAPAENIYVMDTLSRYFDPTSIQIKMSTHPMFVTKYVAGGNTIMKFDFPNINLADSSDHLHRDGMLMYTIKNKPSLLGGLVLKSQAGIYFDYNDVLMTNVANVTVGCPWPLSTDDISSKNIPVTLHPNPATDELTITSPANKYERLSITNMLGERIMNLNMPKPTTTIDISTLPAGMYIVTLYGSKGSEVKKFVKE